MNTRSQQFSHRAQKQRAGNLGIDISDKWRLRYLDAGLAG